MKIKMLSTLILGVPMFLNAPVFGQTCPPKPTRLQFAMSVLGGDLRPLGQNILNPSLKDQNLEVLLRMKIYTEASSLETPPKAELLAPVEKEIFMKAYEEKLLQLGNLIVEIQVALNANDFAAAQVGVQKIAQLRKEGHLEFQD